MKFVCRKCETFMLFQKIENPAEESLGVTFTCPTCGSRISMVTNPGETQLVTALGVKLGGRTEPVRPMELTRETLKESAGIGSGSTSAAVQTAADGGKASGASCPFSEMIGQARQAQAEAAFTWTAEAKARLERIPDFMRPMVERDVEGFARTKGYAQITPQVIEESRNAGSLMEWAPEAAQRLANIPDFIRPMAKKEIERLARERGVTTITAAMMDESKKQFMGMGYQNL